MKMLSLLFLTILLGVSAFSKTDRKFKAGYFYTVPEESSIEFPYQIPECPKLTKAHQSQLLKCSQASEGHEVCTSQKTVQLSHSHTNKKQKFKLIFHLFTSMADCKADREAFLTGEGE
jgi:hypothetical protein